MIVTVSNQYGAGALDITVRAAQQLGYRVVDRELPVVVAKRLHTSPDAVNASEDTSRNLGERLISGLELATPEISLVAREQPSFDRDCLREVQVAVREFAARGNAFIVGRAAHAILGRRDDVLRVFMYAPREWRITRVSESLHVPQTEAQTEVDRIDRARRAYVHDYYQIEWVDPKNYDLCIDTARCGSDGSATLIIGAVRACA
ncbi:MAG: cytidylate kinase-like family protein [Candidatus Eremiobacteraeota bacterium]|nr:cytidylate kinase-like family protein [Candidatus Eremiobacteraeota bacterium]